MQTIYDFITTEKTNYQKPVALEDGWDWSMKQHLRRSFLYKNFQFEEQNENRDLRPNKNIILSILNVQYRTEGFDVKDIDIFIENSDEYYKSFLVKKFHERWSLENKIDTFIDEMVQSYVDYGGALIKNTGDAKPDVVDLRSLAFCNQTDILNNPFCIKHSYSSAQLREMADYGWGEEKNGATAGIEDLISLCKDEKGIDPKEIEVYELHGYLPTTWLKDNIDMTEEKKDTLQIQVVAFYKNRNGNETGITLFKKREPKLPFKLLKRDDIVGRALGRGGIEELFEEQVWTNWSEAKITEMLESASKVWFETTDSTFKTKNNLKGAESNEVFTLTPGTEIGQIDTTPRSIGIIRDFQDRMINNAQKTGSAGEQMLSGDIPSGIPFKLYEAKNIEDKSMHKFRQGQIATFMDELYRDWILPHIQKRLSEDMEFLSELSSDEMIAVGESVIKNQVNEKIKKVILSGKIFNPEEIESMKATLTEVFNKSNKKFISIYKKDIKGKLSAMTNIAGKQKNLALLTDKLVNVLRQFISTPQVMQDPNMVKILNVILESSGMSPIMFSSVSKEQIAQPQPGTQAGTQPLNQFSQVQMANT